MDPRQAGSGAVAASPPKPSVQEGALPQGALALRILVVDDHPLNLKVLESFLQTYGLSADLAHSGEKALESHAQAVYHVVFMDCHMPGMDGYECTRRLRQNPRPGPRLTIIGVTADAMDDNLRKCLAAGMDALLIKPIMEKELRALLAKYAGQMPDGTGF